jgi:hypothetical protein
MRYSIDARWIGSKLVDEGPRLVTVLPSYICSDISALARADDACISIQRAVQLIDNYELQD